MYHPLGKNIGEFNEPQLNGTDKNGCVDLMVCPDLPTKELGFWEFKGHQNIGFPKPSLSGW